MKAVSSKYPGGRSDGRAIVGNKGFWVKKERIFGKKIDGKVQPVNTGDVKSSGTGREHISGQGREI